MSLNAKNLIQNFNPQLYLYKYGLFLENLVLRNEGSVLGHDLFDLLLGPVLDRPVLQLRLGQHQEGNDTTLVLQVFQLYGPAKF